MVVKGARKTRIGAVPYFAPFAPYVHVAFAYFTPAVLKGGHRTRIGAAPYYAPFTLYVHVAFDYFTSAVVYP